jgi:hypothetical protein
VFHCNPNRMTWRQFVTALSVARPVIEWEAGKGPNPADVAPPPPDADALGL